jgi:hypothetical protein
MSEDIPMTFQRIEDRSINFVQVFISTEHDCDPHEGEYSLVLGSFIGGLDLSSIGGVDDISLIKDCIENNLESLNLPAEGTTEVVLRESGEWEGYNWHKYYEIERAVTYGE